MDYLARLCDVCNLHLLVISEDMSYHFKLLDLINGKAFQYLKNEKGFLNV